MFNVWEDIKEEVDSFFYGNDILHIQEHGNLYYDHNDILSIYYHINDFRNQPIDKIIKTDVTIERFNKIKEAAKRREVFFLRKQAKKEVSLPLFNKKYFVEQLELREDVSSHINFLHYLIDRKYLVLNNFKITTIKIDYRLLTTEEQEYVYLRKPFFFKIIRVKNKIYMKPSRIQSFILETKRNIFIVSLISENRFRFIKIKKKQEYTPQSSLERREGSEIDFDNKDVQKREKELLRIIDKIYFF